MSPPFAPLEIGFLQHREGDLIKGRYKVLSHLGGGNFGSVYRVNDTAVGVDLACKEMHVLDNPATAGNERTSALELFKREAQNLATVRHPHIPSAYFEQEEGAWHICPRCGFDFADSTFCPDHGANLLPVAQRFYLMMDFIDGTTLEELADAEMKTQGRPLDESVCLEWIEQISTALRALHRVGIVHRDVKPDNIKIRTTDNAAVLLDFGLTRKSEEAGGYGTARLSGTSRLGTPGYAPPNLQEATRPEPRSDIYALGMTLARLLTGRNPQEAADLEALQAHTPRELNTSISPAVEQIIARSTQADAAKRYAEIDDLLADLHDITRPIGRAVVAPFSFSDGARARLPLDLARLLESHAHEAANYLYSGMLGQWLQSGGYAAPARAAEEAVARWPKQPSRALEIFRRALYPLGASKVLPEVEVEPDALDFDDLDSGNSQTRTLHIRNAGPGFAWGALETVWEEATEPGIPLPGLQLPREWEGNDEEIAIVLDTSRITNGDYRGQILVRLAGAPEQAVAARVPVFFSVQALNLRVEPSSIDFGTVAIGARARVEVCVRPVQSTLGRPRGTFYVSRDLGAVQVPDRFEGTEAWPIEIDGTREDAVARRYEGTVSIDTNGGRLRLPVRYSLSLPFWRAAWMVLAAALIGGLVAGFGRACYGLVNPAFISRWLTQNGTILSPEVAGYGTPIAIGALVGVSYELLRWAREDEIPTIKAGAPSSGSTPSGLALWRVWLRHPVLQGLLLSGLLGAMLCWPLLWIGHWAGWGFGDWLLRPLARPLFSLVSATERETGAPLVWAAVGCGAGMLWGCSRVLESLGHRWTRYALWSFYGVAAFVAFINAMLFFG